VSTGGALKLTFTVAVYEIQAAAIDAIAAAPGGVRLPYGRTAAGAKLDVSVVK
jgi:hypothetical protein